MSEWKMVPVEPTAQMIALGVGAFGVTERYQAMVAAAPAPAFDEAAERKAFEEWAKSEYSLVNLNKCTAEDGYVFVIGQYVDTNVQSHWRGYLACAKRKAGVQ